MPEIWWTNFPWCWEPCKNKKKYTPAKTALHTPYPHWHKSYKTLPLLVPCLKTQPFVALKSAKRDQRRPSICVLQPMGVTHGFDVQLEFLLGLYEKLTWTVQQVQQSNSARLWARWAYFVLWSFSGWVIRTRKYMLIRMTTERPQNDLVSAQNSLVILAQKIGLPWRNCNKSNFMTMHFY